MRALRSYCRLKEFLKGIEPRGNGFHKSASEVAMRREPEDKLSMPSGPARSEAPPHDNKDAIHPATPEEVISTYRRLAPVYDRVFGFVLDHGRRELAKAVAKENPGNLLEIGVGTGLMLHRYPRRTHVVGIDLSEDMLKIAHTRVDAKELTNIELHAMNAEELTFPDESFDCVTLPYVLSVTPNPEKLVSEVRRVCRKDGTIFILGHFGGGRFSWLTDGFARLVARKAKFQPALSYEEQVLNHDWEVKASRLANVLGISRLVAVSP